MRDKIAVLILAAVLINLPVLMAGENTDARVMTSSGLPISGLWQGTTSEGRIVSFSVNGNIAYNFTITYSYSCNRGVHGYETITLFLPYDDITDNKMQLLGYDAKIYGIFTSPTSATGTYSRKWFDFMYYDNCYTGNITWNASPKSISTLVSIQDACVNPGSTTVVPISVNNVADLRYINIWLSYNKDIVRVESVSEGSFSPVKSVINNTAGITTINCSSETGKTGSFIIAYLWLKAVGNPGDSCLLKPVVKELAGTVASEIPHSVGYGTFTVTSIFDTERPQEPYPSISGTHYGTIKPNETITVSALYTYPCAGTGGHTEYVRIWNATWAGVEASWDGYPGNGTVFDAPFKLFAGEEYNYEIITGSYPQIHHRNALLTANGWINCSLFVDANGQVHRDWIPAIKLA